MAGVASYTQLHTHLWVAALWAGCLSEMWHVLDEALVEGFHSVRCCLVSLQTHHHATKTRCYFCIQMKTKRKSKWYEEFGHVRIRWSTSRHMYGAVLFVLSHSIEKYMHVCIAVLTGSGFSSLSFVFISDGCTPLRLTPYATHRRLCTINQTSQTHTQNYMHWHAHTYIQKSLSVHISLCLRESM